MLVWPAATQLGMEGGEISSRVGENILGGEICIKAIRLMVGARSIPGGHIHPPWLQA